MALAQLLEAIAKHGLTVLLPLTKGGLVLPSLIVEIPAIIITQTFMRLVIQVQAIVFVILQNGLLRVVIKKRKIFN